VCGGGADSKIHDDDDDDASVSAAAAAVAICDDGEMPGKIFPTVASTDVVDSTYADCRRW